MGSTSNTFPLSMEMAANTPFNDEKPLLCHVPSHETPVSTTLLQYIYIYIYISFSRI